MAPDGGAAAPGMPSLSQEINLAESEKKENVKLKGENYALQQKLHAADQKIKDIEEHGEIDRTESEKKVKVLEYRCKSLEQEKADKETRIQTTESNYSRLKSTAEKLETKNRNLAQSNKDHSGSMARDRESLKEVKAQNQRLSKMVEEKDQLIKNTQVALDGQFQLVGNLQDAISMFERNEALRKTLDSEQEGLHQDTEKLDVYKLDGQGNDPNTKLQDQNKKLRDEVKKLNDTRRQLDDTLQKKNKALKEGEVALSKKIDTINKRDETIKSLREQNETLSKSVHQQRAAEANESSIDRDTMNEPLLGSDTISQESLLNFEEVTKTNTYETKRLLPHLRGLASPQTSTSRDHHSSKEGRSQHDQGGLSQGSEIDNHLSSEGNHSTTQEWPQKSTDMSIPRISGLHDDIELGHFPDGAKLDESSMRKGEELDEHNVFPKQTDAGESTKFEFSPQARITDDDVIVAGADDGTQDNSGLSTQGRKKPTRRSKKKKKSKITEQMEENDEGLVGNEEAPHSKSEPEPPLDKSEDSQDTIRTEEGIVPNPISKSPSNEKMEGEEGISRSKEALHPKLEPEPVFGKQDDSQSMLGTEEEMDPATKSESPSNEIKEKETSMTSPEETSDTNDKVEPLPQDLHEDKETPLERSELIESIGLAGLKHEGTQENECDVKQDTPIVHTIKETEATREELDEDKESTTDDGEGGSAVDEPRPLKEELSGMTEASDDARSSIANSIAGEDNAERTNDGDTFSIQDEDDMEQTTDDDTLKFSEVDIKDAQIAQAADALYHREDDKSSQDPRPPQEESNLSAEGDREAGPLIDSSIVSSNHEVPHKQDIELAAIDASTQHGETQPGEINPDLLSMDLVETAPIPANIRKPNLSFSPIHQVVDTAPVFGKTKNPDLVELSSTNDSQPVHVKDTEESIKASADHSDGKTIMQSTAKDGSIQALAKNVKSWVSEHPIWTIILLLLWILPMCWFINEGSKAADHRRMWMEANNISRRSVIYLRNSKMSGIRTEDDGYWPWGWLSRSTEY